MNSYFVYGHTDRKVNDGITLEQSHFSKIHESNPSKYRADSGSTSFGWQRSALDRGVSRI